MMSCDILFLPAVMAAVVSSSLMGTFWGDTSYDVDVHVVLKDPLMFFLLHKQK